MNSIAMPKRVCRSFSSFRICACTVTSSAVVGSSAMKKVGLVGERHRDHHALTLTARKLMRIGAEPLGRIGDADLGQKFHDARASLRHCVRRCSAMISPICRSIVCSGLSEVIGS